MTGIINRTEKLSVAALISVILKRKISRSIDVTWLIENEVYAKAIIKLAREQGLNELNGYVAHFELLMFGEVTARQASLKPAKLTHESHAELAATKFDDEGVVEDHQYVGGLR